MDLNYVYESQLDFYASYSSHTDFFPIIGYLLARNNMKLTHMGLVLKIEMSGEVKKP